MTELANGVAAAEPGVQFAQLVALAGVVRRVPKPLSEELLAKVIYIYIYVYVCIRI